MTEFPIDQVRAAFPALQNPAQPDKDAFIFFDNAAGAQSPAIVLNAVANHLLHRNVQRGGRYRQSQEVDEAIAQARASARPGGLDFILRRNPLLPAAGPEKLSLH